MKSLNTVLVIIPEGLREPLIHEYKNILTNYYESRWLSSALYGGRFCEVVYSIILGYSTNNYPLVPEKPSNFVGACKALESISASPRSFQILIPRILPALYEVRNSRNIGHVGGDVDSNYMDSMFVVNTANWIMAELIRIFHNINMSEAQLIVNSLSEYKVPIVWTVEQKKRVLDTEIKIKDQVLFLLLCNGGQADFLVLQDWTECKNRSNFYKLLNRLHKERLIEFNKVTKNVILSPKGSTLISEQLNKFTEVID